MATDIKPDAQRSDAESLAEEDAIVSEEKPAKSGIASNRIVRAAVVVLIIGLAAWGAWAFLSSGGDETAGDGASTTTVTKNGETTLTDTKAGFKITYPADWSHVNVKPATDLVISDHQVVMSANNVLRIKSSKLETVVTKDNLVNMRATIEAGMSDPAAGLVVVDVQETKVANLLAVRYIYKYSDENGPGVHVDFYIFDGKVMHYVVFQVAPAEDYEKYTALFDQVIASFKPLDE